MAPPPRGEAEPAVLGVECSLRGRRWRLRADDDRAALALAQRLALPEVVARVLAGRGVGLDDAECYLNPTLKALLPDPSRLIDMDKAVARLMRAIEAGETIAVFGDYDVDGATSAALLVRFFRAIGREILVYVPDRMREGYGPNAPALLALAARGASLVITVDCGITAHRPLAEAAAAGVDVIVVDHHVAGPELPPAVAVVNPNRLDEDGSYGQLCAAGVTFLLLVALNRALRDAFWYGEGHPEPDLRGFLDLVALGTVCDVVPLTGINRALVTQGIKVMAGRGNPGLRALADIGRIEEQPSVYHAGYVLGPRVNAGGRVGESGLGVRLLATEDADEAVALAMRLDGYNRERQEIEATVLEAALEQAEEQAAAGAPMVMAIGEGWHPGVIGIVAARLREKCDRPACVIGVDGVIGKGSGRSVPGVALGPAVIAAAQAGLLINGGGHAMAAGFTVATDMIEKLRDFLSERVAHAAAGLDAIPRLGIDCALEPAGCAMELIDLLESVGPFGSGNPRPRFAIPNARLIKPEMVGRGHVRCHVTGADGRARVKAIAFNAGATPLGEALLSAGGRAVHLAGHLRASSWRGTRSVELVIEDAAPAFGG